MVSWLSDTNEIINRIKSDDRNAMSLIYERYFNEVKSFICKYGGTEDVAKDIYQDAFIAVWNNILHDKYKYDGYLETKEKKRAVFSSYLKGICLKILIKYLEKNGKNICVSTVFDDDSDYLETDFEVTPWEKLLDETFIKIGEKCKELLIGFYIHRKTLRNLAPELGYKSENVAKSSIDRCRTSAKKIAAEILQQYHEKFKI